MHKCNDHCLEEELRRLALHFLDPAKYDFDHKRTQIALDNAVNVALIRLKYGKGARGRHEKNAY